MLPCLGTGCEFFWKDWGELGAHGTTQQSFNQQFLTAKPFPFVPMFREKDEPAHDQLHGDSGESFNSPVNTLQARLAALTQSLNLRK